MDIPAATNGLGYHQHNLGGIACSQRTWRANPVPSSYIHPQPLNSDLQSKPLPR